MKSYIPVVLAVLVLALICGLLPGGCAKTTPVPENRVAIIDQLDLYEPNAALVDTVTALLTKYSLSVDYYHGEEVTVDFYRQLPSKSYKLIILRSHAGLLGNKEEKISRTCFFTGEAYSSRKYINEQLSDQLAMARIDESYPWVFAVGAKFVDRSMKGTYPGTVWLMMGCSTLYITDLAESLVKKGSASCIGWDASIGAVYMDGVILALVEKLCRDKLSVEKSINGTLAEKGFDPDFKAGLKYYPPESGKMTLDGLFK